MVLHAGDAQDPDVAQDIMLLPDTEALADRPKPCLAEVATLPRDWARLFDGQLFCVGKRRLCVVLAHGGGAVVARMLSLCWAAAGAPAAAAAVAPRRPRSPKPAAWHPTHTLLPPPALTDMRHVPEAVSLYEQLGVKKEPLSLIPPAFEAPLPALTPATFPPVLREPPPPDLELFDLDEALAGEQVCSVWGGWCAVQVWCAAACVECARCFCHARRTHVPTCTAATGACLPHAARQSQLAALVAKCRAPADLPFFLTEAAALTGLDVAPEAGPKVRRGRQGCRVARHTRAQAQSRLLTSPPLLAAGAAQGVLSELLRCLAQYKSVSACGGGETAMHATALAGGTATAWHMGGSGSSSPLHSPPHSSQAAMRPSSGARYHQQGVASPQGGAQGDWRTAGLR